MIEWRPIPGFADYEASSSGGIRRIRPGLNGRGVGVLKGHLLKSTGYYTVGVRPDAGDRQNVCVHRLVCLAFHGLPPSPQHAVAHYDGSRTNNRPENLRWATFRENLEDRARHGRDRVGADNHAAKLLDENIALIHYLAERGFGQRQIAALFQVHQSTIWKVLHRKAWKHVDRTPEPGEQLAAQRRGAGA